jgi:hypothetical protein
VFVRFVVQIITIVTAVVTFQLMILVFATSVGVIMALRVFMKEPRSELMPLLKRPRKTSGK